MNKIESNSALPTITVHGRNGITQFVHDPVDDFEGTMLYDGQHIEVLYGQDARPAFEKATGITPEAAQRALNRLRALKRRTHRCGAQHLQRVPPLNALRCHNCGEILDHGDAS